MVVGSGSGSVVVVVGSGAAARSVVLIGSGVVVGFEAGAGVGIISPRPEQPASSTSPPAIITFLTWKPHGFGALPRLSARQWQRYQSAHREGQRQLNHRGRGIRLIKP